MSFAEEGQAKRPDISDDDLSNQPLPRLANSEISQFDEADQMFQRLFDQQNTMLKEKAKG